MSDEKFETEGSVAEYSGNISPDFISKALRMYQRYKGDKAELHQRIIDNNKWYKSNYSRLLNPKTNETEPATAFIFNAIENKYADAIDNFPAPNLLEREPSDSETAKILSKIIPVELDMCGFKRVYKDNWCRKLKHGTAIYGVFYNENTRDIDIRAIDLMSVYCDMHVRDIQDSQFMFIVNAVDNDILKEAYPDFKPLFHGSASVETYSDIHQIEDRTEIIDCYYKKAGGTLHMMKFIGETVIDATEDTQGYEGGLYEHGMYPVVMDVLYPEEDCPFGFGIVDTIRNPQQYIDKLDGVIIKNAILAGKQRYMISENGAINEKEFTDYSKDVIHITGRVDEEHVRPIQANGLSNFVMEHRQRKIDELKEVIGNRDFQQGGTSSGVNSGTAISTLQQAGQKMSRALIDDSYDAYKNIVYMVIELIREFFDEERIYRITNEAGGTEFKPFDNSMLMHAVEERDALGFVIDTEYVPVQFDISVIPQRESPFTKETNNQTIMGLWTSGFFQPQNFDVALIALQAMNFDGKEKVIEQIQELQQKQQEMMQEQMMQEQQAMQQQIMPQDDELVEVGEPFASQTVGVLQSNKRRSEGNVGGNEELVEVGNFGGGE